MNKKVAIIGGDLRIICLTQMLAKDGFEIYTYALEKDKSLKNIHNIVQCNSLDDVIKNVDIVIGPLPFSNNGIYINAPLSDKIITLQELVDKLYGKIFIAGNIKDNFYDLVVDKQIKIYDLLDKEELVVLNTISTAEGAIQIAMEETIRTIHNSNVLILGYGRVGKTVAYMFKGIGANVFCEARREDDIAWIKTYGYESIYLNELENKLSKFDIIINTIPVMILNEKKLLKINKDCLIIDLASKPGGVDMDYAKKIGIKTIWALALPGKVAPLTSAEYIKVTIYNILKEL